MKTRLIPLLGTEGAAQLHRALLERVVDTALQAGVGPVELWCMPHEDDPAFQALAGRGVCLRRQEGSDLGQRMAHACAAAFERSRAAILLGADCPALEPGDVREAAAALRRHDVVVAPADDGGYVLLGLARPAPVFDDVPWGGPDVMARTRERLRAAAIDWHELRTLWDVDRPEDYRRLQQSGLLTQPGA